MVSASKIEDVQDYEIINEIFSDHLPTVVTLKCEEGECAAPDGGSGAPERLRWTGADEKGYKKKMEDALEIYEDRWGNETPAHQVFDHLRDLIKTCAQPSSQSKRNATFQPKQRWFDAACQRARQKSMRLLNMARGCGASVFKNLYLRAVGDFKVLVKEKKAAYYKELANSLAGAADPANFWKRINQLKPKRPAQGIQLSLDILREHFEGLFNLKSEVALPAWVEPMICDPDLDAPFSIAELKAVIKSAKKGKAPGIDGIPYEFYQQAPDRFHEVLLQNVNKIFESEKVPSSFAKALIFPLRKKLQADSVENVRGISFINAISKIVTGMVLARIVRRAEGGGLLKDEQAGFRRNFSTADNIFILNSIIEMNAADGKKLYAFFVDFSSAFDRVDRAAMYRKLYGIGITTKIVRFVESLYSDPEMAVLLDGRISEWFSSSRGLRQGCLLSPYLFAIFLNDLWDEIGGGIKINERRIKALAYADDVVLLAQDPATMQVMIRDLAAYCRKWNMIINLKKSKIMVFRKGGRLGRTEKWYLDDKEIQVVPKYTYLGITFTSGLSWEQHYKEKLAATSVAIGSCWKPLLGKNDINAGAKLRIFDGVLRSVMCYGAQVLGHKRNNHVEAAQFLFLRKMFGLSSSSPRHVILLESGRRPVYLFTLRIHAKYMGKVLFQHQGRLTHHIAREVLRRGVGWAKDWGNLASENGKVLEEEIGNIQSFKKLWEYLVGKVEVEEIKILEQRAGESKYHQWFLKNYRMSRGPHGYLDSQDFAGVRWCFKLRGELVHLNKKPWRTEEAQRCALCNLQEKEDTLHFMGTCPVLSEFRCRWLGKGRLQEEECLALLSSPDPKKLGGFCREAWSYRYSLITEFNY
ncbi:Reverse transcriptase (RNA-dependent DNA polymerase) [Nesidiocoris tenuis]|uniref:Reverse transcriptase (RNA-dependent DNA polymerase) n=1 Tax=Nesidiocoris tenuis TaxID=355587 RepID=A0ABN7AV52_9HEMI|nr:Reverse transcriptase (RNA-dependent DNA polymerase) [Nesidiocoris tenuis]